MSKRRHNDLTQLGHDCRIWQEFHCHRCPDGGMYIRVKLNMGLNDYNVVVVCPFCHSKHQRCINKGRLWDNNKEGLVKEEICPPKSACSKEPMTKAMRDKATRGGAVVDKDDAEKIRDSFMQERWLELYGGH